MVVAMMVVTVGYLTLSGMLGATKNQTVQYTILIFAFVLGLFAVGYTNGYSTVLPQLEYGALISQLGSEFSEPFASSSYYLWVATTFSLIVGTCGLPHVLVRFYTVESERTARWSTVWGLFFICILYWSAPAFAAFGTDLYSQNVNPTYGDPGMTGAASEVIVVLAAQLSNLPPSGSSASSRRAVSPPRSRLSPGCSSPARRPSATTSTRTSSTRMRHSASRSSSAASRSSRWAR